jgi:hypothetical protein
MQARHCPARGAFKEHGANGMNEAGDAGKKEQPGEGSGRAEMRGIALSNGMRMSQEATLEHGQIPEWLWKDSCIFTVFSPKNSLIIP